MWNLLYSWAVCQLNSSICLMIYLNKRFIFLLKKEKKKKKEIVMVKL